MGGGIGGGGGGIWRGGIRGDDCKMISRVDFKEFSCVVRIRGDDCKMISRVDFKDFSCVVSCNQLKRRGMCYFSSARFQYFLTDLTCLIFFGVQP